MQGRYRVDFRHRYSLAAPATAIPHQHSRYVLINFRGKPLGDYRRNPSRCCATSRASNARA